VDTLIETPTINLRITNQIIIKVGLVVSKQEITPILIKNKNLNIKIIQ